MGFDGLVESTAVIESLKKTVSSYDKKCSTVYALADQIMGIERCEKTLFDVPQDTFLLLHSTISSKIIGELHNLSLIIKEMEEHQGDMDAVVRRMESQCQVLLDKGSNYGIEFQHLRTIYCISSCVNTLIDMKKFHLEIMDFNDIKSFSDARKDTSCKPIERDLEKYIIVSTKK